MTHNYQKQVKENFMNKFHAEMVYLCTLRIEDSVVKSVK